MKNVKVAACQLDTRMGQVEENVTLALSVAECAVAAGAEYILFHENMVHEYPPNAAELAEPAPGPVTERFGAFCARHGVCIGFGMTMRGEPRPYNAAVFINARGEVAATYAKRSLVSCAGYETYMAQREGRPICMAGHERLLEDEVFQPGDKDCVFDWGSVRAGALICADTGRDDYWSAIRDLGATVLFCPFNNPGLRLYHPRIIEQIRTHGLYFVGANRAGSYPMDLPGRGQSIIADPLGNLLAACDGEVNAFITADLPVRNV
jgi:predicted amidohydrolase